MEIRNKSTFCDKSKEKIFFRGSGMKILQKITNEYPNHYLNEIWWRDD
ncbi:11429_t:CDS:2 [Rhizophagus irregularis]|nr:11429_t:CDS:2 [Rhizophagus irregularis]